MFYYLLYSLYTHHHPSIALIKTLHSISFYIILYRSIYSVSSNAPLCYLPEMTCNYSGIILQLSDYGVKAGEGVGEEMRHSVGQRWLFDMTFFFIVNTGVFNLVAGVIITTFGRLREEKEERVANTEGVCFICGIEKHIFDRAANDPDGFKEHIIEDHNMWNYLYVYTYIREYVNMGIWEYGNMLSGVGHVGCLEI